MTQERVSNGIVNVVGLDKTAASFGGNILTSCKAVKLREKEYYNIGDISQLKVRDGLIFVLSKINMSTKLLVFSKDGYFLRQIGRMGGASNEYTYLDAFCLDDNGHVYLFDGVKEKILIYDYSGKYLDRKTYFRKHSSPESVECIGEDSLMYYYRVNVNGPLCEFGRQGDVNTSVVSERCVKSVSSSPLIRIPQPVSNYRGNIRYVLPFDNTIYSLSGECDFIIDTKLPILTDDMLQEMEYDKLVEKYRGKYFMGLSDLCETDKYLICRSLENGCLLFIDKQSHSVVKLAQWGMSDDTMDFVNNILPIYSVVTSDDDNNLVGIITPRNLMEAKNNGCVKFLSSVCGTDYQDDDLNNYYMVFYPLKK